MVSSIGTTTGQTVYNGGQMTRNPKGIRTLRRLTAYHTYRGLAKLLGYKTPSSIQHAIKEGRVGPALAIRINRRLGISLEELGH